MHSSLGGYSDSFQFGIFVNNDVVSSLAKVFIQSMSSLTLVNDGGMAGYT